MRPAWAQTENPGCTYTAHTRGYADLNFELPFSKGGFAIFRPFALHRCEEERFQAILGATPPNNQQFVGCQPTAVVWWLELHYFNRQLQSVTSSTSIPASFRSRLGVILFSFPSHSLPVLCSGVHYSVGGLAPPGVSARWRAGLFPAFGLGPSGRREVSLRAPLLLLRSAVSTSRGCHTRTPFCPHQHSSS